MPRADGDWAWLKNTWPFDWKERALCNFIASFVGKWGIKVSSQRRKICICNLYTKVYKMRIKIKLKYEVFRPDYPLGTSEMFSSSSQFHKLCTHCTIVYPCTAHNQFKIPTLPPQSLLSREKRGENTPLARVPTKLVLLKTEITRQTRN